MAGVRTLNSAKSFRGAPPAPTEVPDKPKPAPKPKAATSKAKPRATTTKKPAAAPTSDTAATDEAGLVAAEELTKFSKAMKELVDTWKQRNTINPMEGNRRVNKVMATLEALFDKHGARLLSSLPAPAATPQPAVAEGEVPVPSEIKLEPHGASVDGWSKAIEEAAEPETESKTIELDSSAGRIEILIRVN